MEPASGQRVDLARFRFVAHPKTERAGNNGKTLVLRVPMWRHLVASRHHEANDEWPRLAGIALQDGDLGTLRHRRRSVAPFNVLGIDEVLFVARSLSKAWAGEGS